jgi:hypothetical protein
MRKAPEAGSSSDGPKVPAEKIAAVRVALVTGNGIREAAVL